MCLLGWSKRLVSRDNTLCIFIMLEFSTVAQSIMPGKHIVNAFQMD